MLNDNLLFNYFRNPILLSWLILELIDKHSQQKLIIKIFYPCASSHI